MTVAPLTVGPLEAEAPYPRESIAELAQEMTADAKARALGIRDRQLLLDVGPNDTEAIMRAQRRIVHIIKQLPAHLRSRTYRAVGLVLGDHW